ncbi:riboflavin biosynthesis protein RibD [Geothrix limicola]|uniref:Riboflavin biosynthesis protein RibD n=1 Tax=Geothrix limicola TaxID=2927978 RepID=A0ABQ5QDG2_9BACT|nr:dihydrofolate reductase family protein [Geothrix limicola]GLH72702.1 riboflavin biosynthesis protein RibD [Geothrix limicola]
MRKLIMWNLITLDGRFEGPTPWSLDWHQSIWGPELEQLSLEQLKAADLLVFGRATYEGMATYWQAAEGDAAEGEVAKFMNRLPKVVFSHTLERVEWAHARLATQDPAQEIPRLKAEGSGDMLLFGSANLAATLMKLNLIDEYRLGLAPVVLGDGAPLFQPQLSMGFRFLEARPLASGGVILRYLPKA